MLLLLPDGFSPKGGLKLRAVTVISIICCADNSTDSKYTSFSNILNKCLSASPLPSRFINFINFAVAVIFQFLKCLLQFNNFNIITILNNSP